MPIGTRSTDNVAKHLDGIRWPARKEEIIERLQARATPDLIEDLRRLPEAEFATREHLLVEFENTHGRR